MSPTPGEDSSLVSASSLQELALSGAGLAQIERFLDDRSAEEQWAQVDGMTAAAQAALFAIAAAGRPLELRDFVPDNVPDRVPVVHRGWNGLPLPAFARRFEKPMCRPGDGSARLFGYNEGATRWLIGPGYFTLHPTAGTERWIERGAQVVDYHMEPDGPVADGWPSVRPNWLGLQLFVYHHTRDFMRRVSGRVTIGRAWKSLLGAEIPLSAYFVLVRMDPVEQR